MMFGLLALGLTISACIPGQQANNTNQNNGTTMADESNDDAAMLKDQEAVEAENSDGTMMEDDENDLMIKENSEVMMQEIKTFDLTGKNFAFSQSEIKVKKGDKVKINFKSTDGFHDWVVDEFNAKTSQVNTGGSTSVEFVADQAGMFEFYCSVGRHREMGMVGKLIVE